MSPEFYAIIGVGISLASLTVGLMGLMLYHFSQSNRRIDRLEDRMERGMNRLEDRIDRVEDQIGDLRTQVNSMDRRLSKIEWIVGADYRQQPGPSDAE